MFDAILKKFLGTKHEREVKRMRPQVAAIGALEDGMRKLSDAKLAAKTAEFKEKLENGAPLDSLLVEAFAVCREAARRVLGMRHYDVQLIGGMVLHSGKIAEMKTGEGKTLVATLPCYLNALEGKGVHVVTVNDYLAKRDAEWMGKLYGFLGLTTGCVVHSQPAGPKKAAYRCDITYGQNNEFGFDYLRDNMKFSIFDYAQRELNYAIVDEVDSILVDEARTPLIISGPGEQASDKYVRVDEIVPRLRKDEHYTLDEKQRSVSMTEDGIVRAQKLLREKGVIHEENLFDPVNLEVLHILNQSLRAHTLYRRDQEYMVTEDQKILIIDEFTGRALPGRRWSDGLHQAVEAKEKVPIQEENLTLATISFQNLFRLYKKLAGMTGTADTEATEFHKIYKLDVVVIPTNKPISRVDSQDLVYKTEREKFRAVVKEIQDCHERGQPVLVGTTSVEKSDALHRMLVRANIGHEILNAKQHEREAYTVAQAGRKGAVTVATNMAGRGTDILLGGNAEMLARYHVRTNITEEQKADAALFEKAVDEETARLKTICETEKKEVIEAGGLHILGTERHESRRIDNQLRGRAGRQGDPGSSRFFLSLEDDLMRIFAGDRIQTMMDRLGMEEDVPIEHPWVTKAVENAQTKVEERNFDIRKHLLEYDDVMNQQRKSVYALRRQVLEGQYRQLPTEEAAKKGAQPVRLVKKVDEKLEKLSAPIVADLVKLATAPPASGTSAEEVASYREAALKKNLEEVGPINADWLELMIYRELGCRVTLTKKEYADGKKAYARFMEEVPMSLSEQRERLLDLVDELVGTLVERTCPAGKHHEDWDIDGLARAYAEQFNIKATGLEKFPEREDLAAKLFSDGEGVLRKKEQEIGPLNFLRFFRELYLGEIDRQWIDHLRNMESLRDGIGLRGYGQRDPKTEYKKEGFDMFLAMMESIKGSVAAKAFRAQVVRTEDIARLEEQRRRQSEALQQRMRTVHEEAPAAGGEEEGGAVPVSPSRTSVPGGARRSQPGQQRAGQPAPQMAGRPAGAQQQAAPPKIETVRRDKPKVGRNDPCWCGSGKKYKNCHLREDEAAGASGATGSPPPGEPR